MALWSGQGVGPQCGASLQPLSLGLSWEPSSLPLHLLHRERLRPHRETGSIGEGGPWDMSAGNPRHISATDM